MTFSLEFLMSPDTYKLKTGAWLIFLWTSTNAFIASHDDSSKSGFVTGQDPKNVTQKKISFYDLPILKFRKITTKYSTSRPTWKNIWIYFSLFFFKQKTAYEIASCLVGSEMCIRDRSRHLYVSLDHKTFYFTHIISNLSLIHIWRCRRYSLCRSRWSPYH